MKLITAVCSRGTVFSRTVEALDANMRELTFKWDRFWTFDKPIPEAQNSIFERCLAAKADLIWMVEEDIVPPDDCLGLMLELTDTFDVVSAKYKMPGGTWCYELFSDGSLAWAGTGCLLVKASVLQKVPKPWFRTDGNYTVNKFSNRFERLNLETKDYGGHDIYFFAELNAAKVKAGLAESVCKHLRVQELGAANANAGCHKIVEI